MTSNIDFKFISDLEGGYFLEGYVPDPNGSQSDVTIATGFDLGMRNENDLIAVKLPGEIITVCSPYLSIKSFEAVTLRLA